MLANDKLLKLSSKMPFLMVCPSMFSFKKHKQIHFAWIPTNLIFCSARLWNLPLDSLSPKKCLMTKFYLFIIIVQTPASTLDSFITKFDNLWYITWQQCILFFFCSLWKPEDIKDSHDTHGEHTQVTYTFHILSMTIFVASNYMIINIKTDTMTLNFSMKACLWWSVMFMESRGQSSWMNGKSFKLIIDRPWKDFNLHAYH